MASAKALMKKMDLSTGKHGAVGLVLDAAVGFGASYGIGHLHHTYSDKWYGKNAPRVVGAVGKLGAIALSALRGGRPSLLVGVVDAVGQAGINAVGLEMGLRHAREKTGKKAVLVPSTTPTAALPAGSSTPTHMGALGKAAPGRGLSWSQIEELASGR